MRVPDGGAGFGQPLLPTPSFDRFISSSIDFSHTAKLNTLHQFGEFPLGYTLLIVAVFLFLQRHIQADDTLQHGTRCDFYGRSVRMSAVQENRSCRLFRPGLDTRRLRKLPAMSDTIISA